MRRAAADGGASLGVALAVGVRRVVEGERDGLIIGVALVERLTLERLGVGVPTDVSCLTLRRIDGVGMGAGDSSIGRDFGAEVGLETAAAVLPLPRCDAAAFFAAAALDRRLEVLVEAVAFSSIVSASSIVILAMVLVVDGEGDTTGAGVCAR